MYETVSGEHEIQYYVFRITADEIYVEVKGYENEAYDLADKFLLEDTKNEAIVIIEKCANLGRVWESDDKSNGRKMGKIVTTEEWLEGRRIIDEMEMKKQLSSKLPIDEIHFGKSN